MAIEERLASLEAEVAKIKAQLNGDRPGVVGRTRPDFLDNYTRRSANSPLFDEVAAAVAAEREREREGAQRAADDQG